MYFFNKPFALEGDKDTIPAALQSTGEVSFTAGYGVDYERNPETDPNAKNIERAKMNWLFAVITENLRQFQAQGVYPYITADDNGGQPYPYQKFARVLYADENISGIFESLQDNNVAAPTDATKWARISADGLVPATRKITTTGIATGGGTLDADLTINVPAPTASVPPTRTISTTAPLTGGGSLETNLTLGIGAAGGATATADGTAGSVVYAKSSDTSSLNKALTPGGATANYVKKAGDTMTGSLVAGVKSTSVNPATVGATGTVTAAYVDVYPTKNLTAGQGGSTAATLRMRGEQNGVLSGTGTYIQALCDLSSQAKLETPGMTAADSALLIRAAGALIAGSGESATGMRSLLFDPAQATPDGLKILGTGKLNDDSEVTILASDSNLYLITNAGTAANARGVRVESGGHIYPCDASLTQDLGSATYKWRYVYANKVSLTAAPSATSDATTKAYVDAKISGSGIGAPIPTASAAVGQWRYVTGRVLPAGGTWAWLGAAGDRLDYWVIYNTLAGISAGGTTVSIPGDNAVMICWRIS